MQQGPGSLVSDVELGPRRCLGSTLAGSTEKRGKQALVAGPQNFRLLRPPTHGSLPSLRRRDSGDGALTQQPLSPHSFHCAECSSGNTGGTVPHKTDTRSCPPPHPHSVNRKSGFVRRKILHLGAGSGDQDFRELRPDSKMMLPWAKDSTFLSPVVVNGKTRIIAAPLHRTGVRIK